MSHEPLTLDIRTVKFSRDVLTFCKNENLTFITRPLMSQLIRSVTSIGANYAEANNAASKADFRSKIFMAKKEAAEAEYWLTLLNDQVSNREKCLELLEECHYILMTFQKIVNTLNSSKRSTANVR